MDIAISRRMPVGNGILTVDTEAQAFARARPEDHDKGGGAARAALALIRLQRSFGGPARPPRLRPARTRGAAARRGARR
jgi:6,7-dimethyl-8-ribityllumazine synthase